MLVDGDRAVEIAQMAGTHNGEFFGVPPSGRHVEVQIAMLLTFADGLIVEERRIYDFTGFLVQVGVLKAAHQLPPADPAREARQIERLRTLAESAKLDPAFAEKFLNFIIGEVIRHHERIAEDVVNGSPRAGN